MNMDKKIIIVPHTHWDREWYLPFQRFRYTLVKLIDDLLSILEKQDFVFMLDGQTILIEDYLEIRPEKKEELLKRIREGKITAGPWYLLPDEWLVGGESLIRNLEHSHDLSKRHNIPLMDVAYLPDQFGHTSAMPQLLGDLTNLKNTVLWRGVPSSIKAVPFTWKSHESSITSINGTYLPFGYGNATMLPTDYDEFVGTVKEKIVELEPFSPVPIYLLMNGSDHLFPQPFIMDFSKKLTRDGLDVSVAHLKNFIELLDKTLQAAKYARPIHSGEFRSPARAHLLQDTYSARMWIKQWNQKIEDLLTRNTEPISTYFASVLGIQYPTGFLETSWKWLLKNQPHDSICGCSVDQTHDEMKTRYSWAESICESILIDAEKTMHKIGVLSDETAVVVYNAGGSTPTPREPWDRRRPARRRARPPFVPPPCASARDRSQGTEAGRGSWRARRGPARSRGRAQRLAGSSPWSAATARWRSAAGRRASGRGGRPGRRRDSRWGARS